MKHKLMFAIEQSLEAAKDLIEKDLATILGAFTANNDKVNLPINLSVNLTNEGLIKFEAIVTTKKVVKFTDEYDPDQIGFDFTRPGSKFGKLDLVPNETEDKTKPDPAEEESEPDPPESENPKSEVTDDANSPALFS